MDTDGSEVRIDMLGVERRLHTRGEHGTRALIMSHLKVSASEIVRKLYAHGNLSLQLSSFQLSSHVIVISTSDHVSFADHLSNFLDLLV